MAGPQRTSHDAGLFTRGDRGPQVAQSCLALCNPMDYRPPGSSVHDGIFQARIVEWVAVSFSRGSSQHRDPTRVSCTAGRFVTV